MKRISRTRARANQIELQQVSRPVLVDIEKAKNQILTELFYSSDFRTKIKKVIYLRRKETYNELFDDVFQEIFLELEKKGAEVIFHQYLKNPGSIVALGITIAKTFFKVDPKYPEYPNKSVVHRIEKMGALQQGELSSKRITPTDMMFDIECEEYDQVVSDNGEQARNTEGEYNNKEVFIQVLENLKTELTPRELKSYNKLLTSCFPVEYTPDLNKPVYKEILTRNQGLMNKIKNILAQKGVHSIENILSN